MINENAKNREYLEGLSDEALCEHLKEAVRSCPPDGEAIHLIVQVMENREKANPEKRAADVARARELFRDSGKKLQKLRRRARPKRWTRIAAAAAVVVLAVGLVTVPAMGFGRIQSLIGRWTQHVFEFFDPTEVSTAPSQPDYVYQTDHPGLQQLYDTVTALGVTQKIVPQQIDEEYVLEELKTIEYPTKTKVHALFGKEEGFISITFDIYHDKTPRKYIKDEEEAFSYELNGITHFIVSNEGIWSVGWIVDNIDNIKCMVSTDCTEEELYNMVDSIYTEG